MLKLLRLLLELGKPRVLALMCLLTLAGAALSPHFLSPDFPQTRLGGTALFLWLKGLFPRAFSPPMWSLAHALGAALVVGLLWLGTALINDLSDRSIDRISSPDRPLPSGRVSPRQALRWALGCQAAALLLIRLEGARSALLMALAGAAIGIAYSLPPVRLRRSGLAANLTIGVGVAMAMVGGMMAQGPVPEIGVLSAFALGLLAAAASLVKDFKDIDGDRAEGVRTLPVLLGVRGAALVNLAAVLAAYLLALGLLVQHTGIRSEIILPMLGLCAANLAVLERFLHNPDRGYAARAYRWALALFTGVTLLYVGAQSLA